MLDITSPVNRAVTGRAARAGQGGKRRVAPGDVEPSRERLLRAALRLFADQGYARTSTREIAEAAEANLAAISYYFGDKAGLYRALLDELHKLPHQGPSPWGGAGSSLNDALRGYFSAYVDPLRQGDVSRQCMKLHLRELLEPTGLWQAQSDAALHSGHGALMGLLCRHLGLEAEDDELARLALCIAALGMHLHLGRDMRDTLAPRLGRDEQSLDIWLDRLVLYGAALVGAERERRASNAA
ncbi:MAG: CerR family C-terminal domain-containing protein [Burkholderiales bacterium]|nr:CerR family C-terminal domain-containing protein [Burkholderiales bacterium]